MVYCLGVSNGLRCYFLSPSKQNSEKPYLLADGIAARRYSYALKITNDTVSPAAEVHLKVFD